MHKRTTFSVYVHTSSEIGCTVRKKCLIHNTSNIQQTKRMMPAYVFIFVVEYNIMTFIFYGFFYYTS